MAVFSFLGPTQEWLTQFERMDAQNLACCFSHFIMSGAGYWIFLICFLEVCKIMSKAHRALTDETLPL